MRVLYVTPEVFPLAKAGGLADVSAALPACLREQGVDVQVLMPGYPQAMDLAGNLRLATVIDNPLGLGPVRLWAGTVPGDRVPVWLVECPSLYARNGGPYQNAEGRDFADNALRFGLLSHVGAMIGTRSAGLSWWPHLIHVNDWQTAPLPSMMRRRSGPHPATVLAIHNLAYQGVFPGDALRHWPMPGAGRSLAATRADSQISFLQAGLQSADRIVTVSPTYAAEITTPEHGCGLDGLLRHLPMPIHGILNGVDEKVWDPARDPCLPATYGADDLTGKPACKSAIQQELGLGVQAGAPLIGFASRLAWQKMPEIVLEMLPALLAEGVQFALVAEGDPEYEASFRNLAAAWPGRVGLRIGYDEAVAHRLMAGADLMLCPARYEPCGLTAVYAMRYGAPPIARRTGGLVDTIVDVHPGSLADRSATGFLFDDATAEAMGARVRHAVDLFRQPETWRRIQVAGMRKDFSWTRSALEYAELYSETISQSHVIPAPRMSSRRPNDREPTAPASIPAASEVDAAAERADFVRRRAYEIWEEQGRPNGRADEHWLQAEAEFNQARQSRAAETAPSGDSDTQLIMMRQRSPRPTRAALAEAEAEGDAATGVWRAVS